MVGEARGFGGDQLLEVASVLVRDGRIAAVGPELPAPPWTRATRAIADQPSSSTASLELRTMDP